MRGRPIFIQRNTHLDVEVVAEAEAVSYAIETYPRFSQALTSISTKAQTFYGANPRHEVSIARRNSRDGEHADGEEDLETDGQLDRAVERSGHIRLAVEERAIGEGTLCIPVMLRTHP